MAMRRSSPTALAHRQLRPATSPRRAPGKFCRSQHDGIQLPAFLRPAGSSRSTATCGRHVGAACDDGHLQTSLARPEQNPPSHRNSQGVPQQSGRHAWDLRSDKWPLSLSGSACLVVYGGGGVFGLLRFLDDIDCNPYVGHPVLCGRDGIQSTACTAGIYSKSLIRTACPVESSSSLPRSCIGRKNTSCNNQTELYCCKPFMHVHSRQTSPLSNECDQRRGQFNGIESAIRFQWPTPMVSAVTVSNPMTIEPPREPLSHQSASGHVFPWPVRVLQ